MHLLDFRNTFKSRGLGILRDDAARPTRSILVAPAETVSASLINEVLHISAANIFVVLSPTRCEAFQLESMNAMRFSGKSHAPSNLDALAMCTSVDAREGITTGISVADRALAISILAETQPNPRKLVKPGHIFPIRAREGGVLVRQGLPEGALDLVQAAGFSDAAMYLDLLSPGGDYLDDEQVVTLANSLNAPLIELSDLTRFRLKNERLVARVAEARLPTSIAGEMRSIMYKSKIHDGEHMALVKGDLTTGEPVLTRVQTEFTFTDVFGGGTPPSRAHIQGSLQAIGERGSGLLLYLRRPHQGALRDQVASVPQDSKPASMMREYGVGAQILADLGISKIELLTNSQRSLVGLDSFGIEIVGQRPIPESTNSHLEIL